MTEKAPNLLPCPFCGNAAPEMRCVDDHGNKTAPECWVACPRCHASSDARSSTAAAIAAWNTRAPTSPTDAARMAAEEAFERISKPPHGYWIDSKGQYLSLSVNPNMVKADMAELLARHFPAATPVEGREAPPPDAEWLQQFKAGVDYAAKAVAKNREAKNADAVKLLEDLEATFDDQTYEQMKAHDFDAPDDAEYTVNIRVDLLRRITRILNGRPS